MTEPFARLRRFLRELKRRKVYRVAVGYLVAAFIVLQLADLAADAFGFPQWFEPMVWVVAGLGLPIAVVLAWAFEVTPEGVRRTSNVDTEAGPSEPASGGLGGWIAALLILVLTGGGVWYVTAGDGEGPAAESTATTDTLPARTASTARNTAGPPRIAVLPFENIAPDSAEDYFAQGMHEEVLNQLSKVSGLGVLSRTTMMEYEDADMTAVEIGRELDVKAILEGTVRRAGDQVRITTQLIDAQRGTHLWSNTYDRRLSVEEIFSIQADIAEQIAGALETQLTGGERRRIETAPTGDLAAYDAYLQGRNLYLDFLEGSREAPLLNRAIERLRDAIDRDSTLAEAHAWLGRAYGRRVFPFSGHRWRDSARAAIGRAKALDPDLAEAYVAEAFLRMPWDQEYITALRRALELQPSHAVAKSELADGLLWQGQYVEAIRVAREAVRLDPRRPHVLQEMGDPLRVVGFDDAAEAWVRRALEIEPGYQPAIDLLAFIQLERGRPDEALKTWKRFLEATDAPPPLALSRAAHVALAAGEAEQARAYLERVPAAVRQRTPGQTESEPGRFDILDRSVVGLAELRSGNRERGRELLRQGADSLRAWLAEREASADTAGFFFVKRRDLAKTLAVLGQTGEALRLLEESASALPAEAEVLLHSPFFDNLRSDPRFQTIVREVEARRERVREEVRQLGIDLYPPGAEPDTASATAGG